MCAATDGTSSTGVPSLPPDDAVVAVRVLFDTEWGKIGRVDEQRLEGIDPILRAIDLTIAEVKADDPDRDEKLATLRSLRKRWHEKAAEAGGD